MLLGSDADDADTSRWHALWRARSGYALGLCTGMLSEPRAGKLLLQTAYTAADDNRLLLRTVGYGFVCDLHDPLAHIRYLALAPPILAEMYCTHGIETIE